jgi:hypothetical protein
MLFTDILSTLFNDPQSQNASTTRRRLLVETNFAIERDTAACDETLYGNIFGIQ